MKHRIATILLAALALLVAWQVRSASSFSLSFLDVGQGDAILVRTPDNLTMLIDGGPGQNILPELAHALGPLRKRIDIVILTHPDSDHYEGLIPVLEQYEVGLVLRTAADKEDAGFTKFKSLVENFAEVYAGDVIKLGSSTTFKVVWPFEGVVVDEESNESSIVGQLEYGNYNFFLTGDLGEPSEKIIVGRVKPEYLRSQVLKPGHHGSKHSSSSQFIEAVNPQISVISVGGQNKYGHPAPEVLERLARAGSKILRTDIEGTVVFTSEGQNVVLAD